MIKIRTVFLFKTILNRYNIMFRKLLLASCTLLFLLETSPTSNVRSTDIVRISKVFKLPFVKIFKRKQLSRPVDPTIPRNIPKVNFKESKSKMQRPKPAIKLYELTQKDFHVSIVKMKYLLCNISFNIKITDSRTPAIWTCSKCYFRELPFVFLRDIKDVNEHTNPSSLATYYVNNHAEKLKEYRKHLGMHI